MLQTDILRLYGQLHMFNAFRRASQPGEYSFGSDALLEFFAGLMLSMSPVLVTERIGRPTTATLTLEVDNCLREYGRLEYLAHADRTEVDVRTPTVGRVRQLVEFEYLFDRMQGYAPHLRAVGEAVLKPVDPISLATLGFRLSDAITAAEVATTIQTSEYSDVRAPLEEQKEAIQRRSSQPMIEFMDKALTAGAPYIRSDLASKIADRSSIPETQIDLLLSALGLPLGSQSVEKLSDINRARRRPVILVDRTRSMWPRPSDFDHIIQDWAVDVCQNNPSLLGALDKSRQTAVETLTSETLSRVFGTDRVERRVRYDSDGRPDIDILVTLPRTLILVEVKGGRFTDPARRGAPDRVEKKRGELVMKALSQNDRAAMYITGGDGRFWDHRGRRFPNPDPAARMIRLVVTLERVDPLYSYSARWSAPEDHSKKPPRLVVRQADLLLMADTLPSPHEFIGYLRDRAVMCSRTGVAVSTEADALGL